MFETEVKVNPFLTLLKKQARLKGIPLKDVCMQIGYSPGIMDALRHNDWFTPSEETLALSSKALEIPLVELKEQLVEMGSDSASHPLSSVQEEISNLYELVKFYGCQHELIQLVRRRVERILRSQDADRSSVEILDEQAGLAEIETFYSSLGPRNKAELVRLLQRTSIHFQVLKERDADRRLGFEITKLGDIL